jgi:hypothetical protein
MLSKRNKDIMKSNKTRFIPGILAGLLGFIAAPSFALPTSEVEVVYFKDATYSREVGYVVRGCQGDVIRQGTTSRYQARSSTPCHGGASNEIACYAGTVQTTCPANICDSSLFDCQ